MKGSHESLCFVILKSLADFSLFMFYMLDHVIFAGRVKLITDMRPKFIAELLCDWFWLFEIAFSIPSALIDNSILKGNLEKISKGEVKFIVDLNYFRVPSTRPRKWKELKLRLRQTTSTYSKT